MRTEIRKVLRIVFAVMGILIVWAGEACAALPDAADAERWLDELAGSIAFMQPLNEPTETLDPGHEQSYLMLYGFGSVTAMVPETPVSDEILSVELTTPDFADCRGVSVGDMLRDASEGKAIDPNAYLTVLSMTPDGSGWCWAYADGSHVYGIEYIALDHARNGGCGYTLTYVLENDTITAIRLRRDTVSAAQAEESIATAREIAARQGESGDVLVCANAEPVVTASDLTMMDLPIPYLEVDRLVGSIGEPVEVQNLPYGGGRLLLYEGAVFEVGLHERTGEEIVRCVTVTGAGIPGPRGLTAGMGASQIGARFCCREDVGASGGILYLDGEALDEPPCGRLRTEEDGTQTFVYVCEVGDAVWTLEVGMLEGEAAWWRLAER